MCGITGLCPFDPDRSVDEQVLRAMTASIRHRGPDSDGFLVRPGIGLGFRRLAVIDLSSDANQPMCNEDGSVWIVFNGEFYGFRDHRSRLEKAGHLFRSRSDTETILHLYEQHGIDCLQYIDGMFAFALWDGRNKELYLVRDRLGIKPLYYTQTGDTLVFGSEIKALLEAPGVGRDLDPAALHHYLTFMTVPAPRTMFRGIHKLLPGHYLRVRNGTVEDVRYWDIPREQDRSLSEGTVLKVLDNMLYDAVQSQLVSDVPLGAFLSGGLDSSTVVAMMRSEAHRDVRTFAITFPGMGAYDEGGHARQVSAHLGTQHTEFAVTPDLASVLPKLAWHFDEPFAVSSAFALYFLARMAREEVTVALSGDGGDELFAGYPFRYSMDQRFGRMSVVPRPLRAFAATAADRLPAVGPDPVRDWLIKLRTYASFFRDDADMAFFRTFTFFGEDEKDDLLSSGRFDGHRAEPSLGVLLRHYEQVPRADSVNRRLYADLKTTLVDEMLTKVDRMTMASSLEARVPLLDHRLVEFAATIPGHLKIRGREGKLPLKHLMRERLPAGIADRKKHGFNVPVAEWLRADLRGMLHDLLSDDAMRRQGIFRPGTVQRLIDDHLHRRRNNVGQLYILLTFQVWYRMFIERSDDVPAGTAA